MAIQVLDDYYLAITLLVTIAYQLFFFSIAWTFHFDKVTDFAGGTNFTLLAVLTLSLSSSSPTHTPSARQILVSIFLILWSLRLSTFLLYRILKSGSDTRFDDKRNNFFSFLGFWIFQMLWVWTVSLPVTLLNSPAVQRYPHPRFGRASDVAGVVIFVVGLLVESVSDVQKFRWRTKYAGNKSAVCDGGLWGWSRHPNYFGEIVVQFAIFMIAVTPAAQHTVQGGAFSALYASILGPFFLTALLLFLSGLPLQERPGAKKRYESGDKESWLRYKHWLDTTSILIPMPPAVWSNLPVWVKRTVGCEWPMYVFDPAKHSNIVEVDGNRNGSRSEEV